MADLANQSAYIPWHWSVRSSEHAAATCPSQKAILGTFAVVNVIVGVLSIVCGHRKVTAMLTRKKLGHRNSTSWRFLWIIIACLQLAANALIAKVIKWTPGYESGFSTLQLTLFFTARPRISWILGLLFSFWSFNGSPPDYSKLDQDGYSPYGVEGQSELQPQSPPRVDLDPTDWVWRSSAFSQFIAEIVLQLITSYTMGITVAFATRNGYYVLGNVSGPVGHNAHIMYAAALYWLCGQSVLLTLGLMLAVAWFCFRKWPSSIKMHGLVTIMGIAMLPLSWMATWLFWAGYVRLARDLYCPPKLELHAIIWVAFSFVGIILGTGVC